MLVLLFFQFIEEKGIQQYFLFIILDKHLYFSIRWYKGTKYVYEVWTQQTKTCVHAYLFRSFLSLYTPSQSLSNHNITFSAFLPFLCISKSLTSLGQGCSKMARTQTWSTGLFDCTSDTHSCKFQILSFFRTGYICMC